MRLANRFAKQLSLQASLLTNFNTISEKDNEANCKIPFMALFCFLEWSGTEPTITEAAKWPVVPAPEDDG
jgi:hypothetical protein